MLIKCCDKQPGPGPQGPDSQNRMSETRALNDLEVGREKRRGREAAKKTCCVWSREYALLFEHISFFIYSRVRFWTRLRISEIKKINMEELASSFKGYF